MRLIFAGTPEFARVALAQLHSAGHDIVLVLSQPDRPAGRGLKLHPCAVKQFALDHGLTMAQPRSLRLDGKYPQDAQAAQAAILAAKADAMVVAAYGLILPQWVLDAPTLGCFNIHGSLLPRWRGAAPIHRAIEAGDLQTGITLMQMDAGLDTGAMLAVQHTPILASDTTASLHDTLAALGGRMVVATLADAANGRLAPVAQPTEGVSYAHKIEKHEAAIDWADTAERIVLQVRAFNPFPVATAHIKGETLKIWHAQVAPGTPPAGTACGAILALTPEGVLVAALNSTVALTELQRAGAKRMSAADLVRGFELQPGMVFEKRVA